MLRGIKKLQIFAYIWRIVVKKNKVFVKSKFNSLIIRNY